MIRYLDGWQLHAYVEHTVDGPGEACISSRHLARDILHITRFSAMRFRSSREATDYIDAQLFSVKSVADDGTLRF